MEPISVVGGGLAGCEAAWQIAKRGGKVVLYEMKPRLFSPAHRSPDLAEIVCSNSFKSESLENAHGVLKAEMEKLDSLILKTAKEVRVPAGDALAVDREKFSRKITGLLESMDGVLVMREELKTIPSGGVVLLASGPLTSEALSQEVQKLTGAPLFFYDAISPIVTRESIDFEKAFMASRYGKGGEDYINCPMDEALYDRFVKALVQAEKTTLRDFERRYLFEGCLPVEELADRGRGTLAFGPLKPVGLIDPRTGIQPFAVVQLRQENEFGTLFNLVGFQTRLKQGEQRRVFRMIPGLERAEFARYGSIHRNTFIDSPRLLNGMLQFRKDPRVFVAGQLSGVEGYMESTAIGLLAGINAYRFLQGKDPVIPPRTTSIGSLVHYITQPSGATFQPMNINFGLFPPLSNRVRGRKRRQLLGSRALSEMTAWIEMQDP